MSNRIDHVTDWLCSLQEANLPPLCLELVLRDGRSFYVRSVLINDTDTQSLVLRIYDFRAMTQEDHEALLAELNDPARTSGAERTMSDLHPALDQGNLRIHVTDIAYCIEWHDRLWPVEVRRPIGF